MKNWKIILLILSILLLLAAFGVYAARIASCYPSTDTVAQFSPEYVRGFRDICRLDSPLTTQFFDFLVLFIPGIILFSAYWLMKQPRVRSRRAGMLSVFLLLLMFDSLLVMVYGLLGYPAPGVANAPAAWAVEAIASLGFLCYLGALAIWQWKRWGLMLFQGASFALAIFILLGGGSIFLAVVIVGGVIILSLLLRPVRAKME